MPSFLVVFTGQYLEGRAPMDVEAAMSDALKLSLPQREKIFSGKPIVLKRTNDKAAALSMGQQLKAFGRYTCQNRAGRRCRKLSRQQRS